MPVRQATETAIVFSCESAAIECHERLGGLLRYYRPERLKWQGRVGSALRPLDSAV